MKLRILLTAFVLGFSPAVAQKETVQMGVPVQDVKLYRVTAEKISGKKTDGIVWAVTDSSLVYFDDSRAAIREVQAGIHPQLNTVWATAIKRIAIRQRRYSVKNAGIGVGIATTLFLFAQSSQTSTLEGSLGRLIVSIFIAPTIVITSIVSGFIPPVRKQISGNVIRFAQLAPQLKRYGILFPN